MAALRTERSSAALAAAAGLVAAVTLAAFGRVPLDYDSYFALVWGRELWHGHLPHYQLSFAPTPHPLYTALGALLSPLGLSADTGLRVIAALALGALCAGVYRLGQSLAGSAAGALAAAIVVTRAPILEFTNRAADDIPALALVVWAAALLARAPRRAAPVLVLLAVAGLLRPEAWLLAAAYWLWLAPRVGWRQRVAYGALVVAAPLAWLASDLAITGNALWSHHQTGVNLRNQRLPTGASGIGRVPGYVGGALGVPTAVAALIGLAAVLRWRPRRAAAPVATAAVSLVAAVALAVAHQPMLQRFFFLLVAIAAAFAAAGALPDTGRPRAWRAAGVVAAALIVAGFALEAPRIVRLRDHLAADQQFQRSLRSLVGGGPARTVVRRCRPIYMPAGGLIPTVAFAARAPIGSFSTELSRPGARGVLIVVAGHAPRRLPYGLPPPVAVPAGYSSVARNAAWLELSGCRP